MQHIGDLDVTDEIEQIGQVTGTTYVRNGGYLVAHGQLSGGLIIDEGGVAVIHGQVSRDVINNGSLTIYGQIVGRIHGNPPLNALVKDQLVGNDLPVPFTGKTVSWSYTTKG